MSFTAKLDALRQASVSQMPDEAMHTMQGSIENLSRSGILDRSLKVGDRAPDFVLPNALEQDVHLRTLLKKGPVVVIFYRGRWCPFCSAELQAYESVLKGIEDLGATLVAISPQTPDQSLTTQEKQNLTFEVLSDVHNELAQKFGIVYHVQDEIQALYVALGLDLPEYNGDHSFDLPVPATYVIDQQGIIKLAFVDPDYTRRADPAEVLSVLQTLNTQA